MSDANQHVPTQQVPTQQAPIDTDHNTDLEKYTLHGRRQIRQLLEEQGRGALARTLEMIKADLPSGSDSPG